MNELQLALIAAGGLVVAAVWAYNLWQERRHKKVAEEIFKGDRPDVLLQGQGGDDADEAPARAEPTVSPQRDERIEPGMEPVGDAAAEAAEEDAEEAAVPPPPTELADPVADCTLQIGFAEAVSAPALWEAQRGLAEQLTKPLVWSGHDGREWRRLSAHDAGHYGAVAASLQFADRQGAVGAIELSTFLDGVRDIAQQFGGSIEVPQAQALLDHATALDGFCASVDVQLGVGVVEAAGGDFTGTKLRGLAEAAGMVLQGDGRFHAVDERGEDVFTLANIGSELFDADTLRTLTTHGLSFTLDVPRVTDGTAGFDRMLATAKQMAQTLGGVLVDGQRHPLHDATIAGIRAKIGEIQQQMAANQIAAGSPRALRLFS